MQAIREHGKRLDYILYRPPSTDRAPLACVDCTVSLTTALPTRISYSDHFGVEASYTSDTSARPPAKPIQDLTTTELSAVREAFQRYLVFSAQESKQYLALCGVALVLALLLFPIGSSYVPLGGAMNWLFVWLGAFSGAAAATLLYVGFLAGREVFVSFIRHARLLNENGTNRCRTGCAGESHLGI